MNSALIILAIAVSVFIGYKTGYNTGFFAIIFAYLIGSFVLGMRPRDVISGWPISTMFVIMATSLFYNFATANGTLEIAARNLLYAFRKMPKLIPLALYFAAAIIAALGAGFFTVLAFMAPIAMLICDESKTDKLLGAVAVNCGALSGANFMTSGSGVIFRGVMTDAGYANEAFNYSTWIFVASVIFSILFIVGLMILTSRKSTQTEALHIEKAPEMNEKQKQTMTLIVSMVVLVLIFPILNIILPNSEIISYINARIDIGLIAIIFAVIALFLKLAPQKEVVANVPWNTIIMICGVGMLINVAIQAGTIDLLAQFLGDNIPNSLIILGFSIIAAVMSFFSSTLGVVVPALFPLVPAIAQSTGLPAVAFFVAIVVGAQSSAISPFSSGGSLILGSIHQDSEQQDMFKKLLFVAVPVSVIAASVFNYLISFITTAA